MNARSARPLLIASLLLFLSGCSYELQHNLSEDDANDIYELLSTNGISAKKVEEQGHEPTTYLIVVAKTDAAQSTQLLRQHSLPRPKREGWDAIQKNKGMIPTEMEQRAMFLEALQGEIERGLNKLDGVLEVHVIPMQPENNDLTQPEKKPANSAGVVIKYRRNSDGRIPLDEQRIREWVASTLPDTRPDNVKVLLTEAHGPEREINPSNQMVTHFGMQMTASSFDTFKLIMGVLVSITFVMIGVTSFMLLKGGQPPPGRR